MPLNHPTRKLRNPSSISAQILFSGCVTRSNAWIGHTMKAMASAERISPSGRNFRAFERSLTEPMRNFDSA